MGKKKPTPHPIYRAALAARRKAGEAGEAPGWRYWLDVADAAKLVRSRLRAKFPGVTFRVRSSRYSGGASVGVSWTDGPREREVRAVVGAYSGKGFDGMTDYEYSVGAWLHPDGSASIRQVESYTQSPQQTVPTVDRKAVPISSGASYVQCQREVSPERWAKVMKAYAKKYGGALADAINAGTVATIGDAGRVFLDQSHEWGNMALRRFEADGFEAEEAKAATG